MIPHGNPSRTSLTVAGPPRPAEPRSPLARMFRDHEITFVPFEGTIVAPLPMIEQAWGYALTGLTKQIPRWVEKGLIHEVVHFEKLEGARFEAFRKAGGLHFADRNVQTEKARHMTVITERGLYRMLMLIADKEIALEFQGWLEDEVLPAINRTGTYTAPGANVSRFGTPTADAFDMAREFRLLAKDLRRRGEAAWAIDGLHLRALAMLGMEQPASEAARARLPDSAPAKPTEGGGVRVWGRLAADIFAAYGEDVRVGARKILPLALKISEIARTLGGSNGKAVSLGRKLGEHAGVDLDGYMIRREFSPRGYSVVRL